MVPIMTHLALRLSTFFPVFEIELALPDAMKLVRDMTIAKAKEEEVAQQSHGRHHAQIRLAIVSEDGQEEDGVGM